MKKILPLLACLTLVGCNNGLKAINESTALERAAGILERQKAETFATPDCFTVNFHNYVQNETIVQKSQAEEGGGIFTTYLDLVQYSAFNLKKYTYYEKRAQTEVGVNGMVYTESNWYFYYDKSKSTYYEFGDNNGKKYLNEYPNTNEEEAKVKLNVHRKKRAYVLKFQQILTSFKAIVDNTNKLIEELKDSQDEYAKISYASSNKKSLKVDYGYKLKDKITIEGIGECAGYHVYDESATYANDLLLDRKMSETNTYANDDATYTTSLLMSNDIQIDQTHGDVKLPSLDDYR